jgi:hypothetical protein
MTRHNDRGDAFRRGARAARPLPGRLDYIRDRLTEIGVLIIEAARDADTQQRSRWAHSELVHLGADVAELIARCRELRAEMMDKGMSAHALGAPVPLILTKRTDEAPRLSRGNE